MNPNFIRYTHIYYRIEYNAVALKEFSKFYCKRNKYYFQKREKKNEIYIVKNFQLMLMINSKHSLYAISSGILMMMMIILLSPLHTIKAQEKMKKVTH